VVIPAAMETLNSSTLQLLNRCKDDNVPVLALAVPGRVDGRLSDEPAKLCTSAGWKLLTDNTALVEELRRRVPPYITNPRGEAIPGGLVWRRVLAEEGIIWFFCNPWAEPIEQQVLLKGASAQRLDTASGQIEPYPSEQHGECICVKLTLPSRCHELLLVSDRPAAPVRRITPKAVAAGLRARPSSDVKLHSIRRLRENLLYIDYCDLETYGRHSTDINTAAADTLNWRRQGFEGNPWFMQFQRTLIDRLIHPDTGFTVAYRFTIAPQTSPATLNTLRAGIERPELYRLDLNGTPLDVKNARRWFDENMAAIPIGHAASIGENVLTLTAQPFNMLCAIMPVYIIGNFSLKPAERGFAIHDPVDLEVGDWTIQGMPFYPDAVRYQYGFSLEHETKALVVRIPRWTGSVIAVHLNGREAGVVMHPPYELRLPGLHAGEHSVAVDVIGNMQSMMGSHHHRGLPLRGTFEVHSPQHMPPGRNYRFDPAGLLDTIELFEES